MSPQKIQQAYLDFRLLAPGFDYKSFGSAKID